MRGLSGLSTALFLVWGAVGCGVEDEKATVARGDEAQTSALFYTTPASYSIRIASNFTCTRSDDMFPGQPPGQVTWRLAVDVTQQYLLLQARRGAGHFSPYWAYVDAIWATDDGFWVYNPTGPNRATLQCDPNSVEMLETAQTAEGSILYNSRSLACRLITHAAQDPTGNVSGSFPVTIPVAGWQMLASTNPSATPTWVVALDGPCGPVVLTLN